MRRRLLASTALIALAAVLVLGLPLGIVESRRAHSQALGRLEREADGVAAAVEDRFESGRPLDLAALHRLLRPGHRVQIVSPAGAVTVVGPPLRGRSIRAGSGVVAGARVIALAPAREVAERARRTWVLIGLLAAGGVAAAIALALVQRRRLARPLEHVARASALLGTGDFSVRAGRFAIPEIDAVASALDASAVRIARLVARQREFGVNVSHQLRTPLTALRLRLEELSLIDDRKLAEHEVSKALAEVDRLEGMVADLLAHAGTGEPGDARALSLDELARAHIASWRALYRRAGQRLTLETAPAPRAWARPGSVGQVLDVLLENALRHGVGPVTVRAGARDERPVLTVSDVGPGIPAGGERRIFERGGSLNGGSGVGLHLARALAESEGGRLSLAVARPPSFELRLPPLVDAPGDGDPTSIDRLTAIP